MTTSPVHDLMAVTTAQMLGQAGRTVGDRKLWI
jgi:hypothetical protein